MPIVYIHGVSVRDESDWDQIEMLLRRFIAPVISPAPENVPISYCFWGDQAANLSWGGSSIPASPGRIAYEKSVRKARAEGRRIKQASKRLFRQSPRPNTDKKISQVWKEKAVRLRDLSSDRLSNIFTAAIQSDRLLSSQQKAALSVAADEMFHSRSLPSELDDCNDLEEETTFFQSRLLKKYRGVKGGQGFQQPTSLDWSDSVNIELQEYAKRTYSLPASAATKMVMEMREPLSKFVTLFLGDVFTYIYRRGTHEQPGPIPTCVLEHLEEAGALKRKRDDEPLVVLTHSMGGQIMYDMLTHFLPERSQETPLRVDFWCATASQVGFFEELKLFLASSTEHGGEHAVKVPYPDTKHLGYWWNVWDYSDFVSYSADPIIEGVDDEAYDTGMDLIGAHIGYLLLPSFYRRFAVKVKKARSLGWRNKP